MFHAAAKPHTQQILLLYNAHIKIGFSGVQKVLHGNDATGARQGSKTESKRARRGSDVIITRNVGV